jgi:hypothetical protein
MNTLSARWVGAIGTLGSAVGLRGSKMTGAVPATEGNGQNQQGRQAQRRDHATTVLAQARKVIVQMVEGDTTDGWTAGHEIVDWTQVAVPGYKGGPAK